MKNVPSVARRYLPCCLVVTAFAAFGPICGTARAQILAFDPAALEGAADPAAKKAAQDSDEWKIRSRFGFWFLAMEGDVAIGGREADVDASFSDISEYLDYAVMPNIEVSKDRWVFGLNALISRLSEDVNLPDTAPTGDIVVTNDMVIIDLSAGYRLWDIPVSQAPDFERTLTVTPAVGARYTYLGLELDPDNFEEEDGHEDWVDPYVGASVGLGLIQDLSVRVDGSIGGFGVGSDTAWSAQAILDWQFSDRFGAWLGYRALDWDFDDGDFEWDIVFHGPMLGISALW